MQNKIKGLLTEFHFKTMPVTAICDIYADKFAWKINYTNRRHRREKYSGCAFILITLNNFYLK